MEESKISETPSKYRLLKLPEIDIRHRPKLKAPERKKLQSLNPQRFKESVKPSNSLRLSLKSIDHFDQSTVDEPRTSYRKNELSIAGKHVPEFSLFNGYAVNKSTRSSALELDTMDLFDIESTKRRANYHKLLREYTQRRVQFPSVGPNVDAEPVKHQIELHEKNKYFDVFKKMDNILAKNALSESPANFFLKECHSNQLLPVPLRMHHSNGSLKSIKMSHYRMGDKYVSALAEGFALNGSLEKLNLRQNRISDLGALPLLDKVPRTIRQMDLSYNNMGYSSISRLCFIITSALYSEIAWINLEANRLGDRSVSLLCQALKKVNKLKVLNLSRNEISDECVKDMGEAVASQRNLEQLYLHWNRIKSKGGAELFVKLIDTPNLRQLDISGNRLGSDTLMLGAKKLSEFVANHKKLVHLDISNNCLQKDECQVIAEGLSNNHSILGVHIAGNKADVDSLGFIQPQDTLNVASQVLWSRMPQRRKYFSKKMIQAKASGRCWICEGWREVEFTWANTDPSLTDPEPVYLHLDFDDWKGDLMLKKTDNIYSSTRMCPPSNIKFFFTILNETQHLGEGELLMPVDDEEKAFKAEELGILKDVVVQKVNLMEIDRFDVFQQKSFDFAMECRPRPDPKIWKAKTKLMKRDPWKFETSVFKDWKPDNDVIEKACFEYDWSFSKIPRLIKEESEIGSIKEMLWKNYPRIRAAFKHISGITPQGNIFSIPLNSFTEFFVNKCELIDQKTLKLPDVDRNFIATNYSDKKGLRNPAQALVRFQLMEIIVRLALDKYLSNKLMTSYKEALETLLSEFVMPYCNTFDHHKWREKRFWNEEVDRVYKLNWNFVNKLFDWASIESKKRAGSKRFVSIDEFCKLCSDGGLVETFITERDPTLIYSLSMMTVVNELENERGSQMLMPEFIEALGRVADRLDDKEIPNCKGLETKLLLLLKTLSKNLYSNSIEILEPPPIVEEWEV